MTLRRKTPLPHPRHPRGRPSPVRSPSIQAHGLVGTAGETAFALGQAASLVRMALAPMRIQVRDDLDRVMHVVVCRRLPHAAHHAHERQTLVPAQSVQHGPVDVAGGKDGGVSRDLRVVDGQVEPWSGRKVFHADESIDAPRTLRKISQRVEVVVRDVLRVGARIGRQLLLVQGLQRGQRARGGQPDADGLMSFCNRSGRTSAADAHARSCAARRTSGT